jgi:hypothetical protein
MGSGVSSTVTNGEGKITIEKANEEVLIRQLKEVYKHNPDQMKRMWEQISKTENRTEVLNEKKGNKDAETAKVNTNSPPTMEKAENNNVNEMVVGKNTEVSKDNNNSSSSSNNNENSTEKSGNKGKRLGIKIGSKITQEALDALNKLPTEVNISLKSQIENLIKGQKQNIVLNTSDGSCNILYQEGESVACSAITYGVQKGIFDAMNELRANPKAYAEKYLSPRLGKFEGNIFKRSNGINQMTHEGTSAVKEAIDVLSKTPPIKLFEKMPPGMALAALDHVNDTGPKGLTGHDGSDGCKLSNRLDRYGAPKITWGENIDYGNKDPHAIVSALLIDDGVANRGHRNNLLNGEFVCVGIAVGLHKQYGDMCVMDYAGGWGVKKIVLKDQVTEKFSEAITPKATEILNSLPDGLDLKPEVDQAIANGSKVELIYKPGEVTLKIISGEGTSTRTGKWGVQSGGGH